MFIKQFLCFVGVCSLCGNSMLLYVSYKKKHLLKPAEFFIINLAISDLGMTVSLYPLAVTSSLAHRYDFIWRNYMKDKKEGDINFGFD